MKAVILAGGRGTRLSEETHLRPKPMVEIGGKPILWHIMKIYSTHGINEFIICCGFKGYVIKEYFANYFLHMSDFTMDMKKNKMKIHHSNADPWIVIVRDTGENSMTGGRVLRASEYLNDDDTFCFTYGDGLSDVDISKSISFHKSHGKAATLTATFPPARFGALDVDGIMVKTFTEKPKGDRGRVNGGFFVLSPSVLDLIDDDMTTWEEEPLIKLAKKGQLMAYEHNGFWQPMDTLRDKNYLDELWASGKAPWKTWK